MVYKFDGFAAAIGWPDRPWFQSWGGAYGGLKQRNPSDQGLTDFVTATMRSGVGVR